MSMNIHFYGVRDVQVIKTGRIEQQTHQISVWQTPTKDTYEILDQPDPVRAYARWAADRTGEEKEPIYAEDDIFGEGEPIGYDAINPGRMHAADFLKIVRMLRRDGYEIVAEAW